VATCNFSTVEELGVSTEDDSAGVDNGDSAGVAATTKVGSVAFVGTEIAGSSPST